MYQNIKFAYISIWTEKKNVRVDWLVIILKGYQEILETFIDPVFFFLLIGSG